jgi:hypothetical protein
MAKKYINIIKDDANVIAVDWSEGSAGAFYPLNALVVYLCGFQVGEFLRKAAIPAANVHCIGMHNYSFKKAFSNHFLLKDIR